MRRGVAAAGFSRRVGALFSVLILVMGGVALAGEVSSQRRFHAEDVSARNLGRVLRLQDSSGNYRNLSEFRGNVVLVFFGFTQCPDVCPTELARLAEVRRGMGPSAQKLQVLFVTLDPERDSAEFLREYALAFDASFIALRGTTVETEAAASEFRVAYQKVPGSAPGRYTIDHSIYVYAIDPAGRLRLRFTPEMSNEMVREDLAKLLAGD